MSVKPVTLLFKDTYDKITSGWYGFGDCSISHLEVSDDEDGVSSHKMIL